MSLKTVKINKEEFKSAVEFKIRQGSTLSVALDEVLSSLDGGNFIIGGRTLYTYKGVTGNLKYLCEVFNLKYKLVWDRMNRGYSIEDAMSENFKNGILEYKGVRGSLHHICKTLGVSYNTVRNRLDKDYTLDDAFSGKKLDSSVSRRFSGKQYTYKGLTGNLAYLCREFNFNYATANKRLNNDFSIEDVFSEFDMRHTPKKKGDFITYKGYTGILKDVCNHFGLNYSSVRSKIYLKGMSTKDALNYFYNKKNVKK